MDSDLYLAVLDDNIDVLKGKEWLQVRDQLTHSNNTVLHLACQYGSMKCVNEILQHADESLVLQINSRGETALHLAAREGHYDAVEELINKAKSSDPQLPNNLENPSTVLQNLIRATNVEFETALHATVRHRQEGLAELLVKEDPSYAYPQNKYGETPLYLAAVRGYDEIVEVILENCESPTFGGPDGRTALHGALTSSRGTGCVRYLLRKKKDLIKVADNNGWTAFHFAAHNNLWNSIEELVEIDKSMAYLAEKGEKKTALHIAAYKGHNMVVKKLLKYLPDAWDSVDGNGQNILHIAVKQNQKDVIEVIFSETENQKDVIEVIFSETRTFESLNTLFVQKDKEGNTPLHLIAKLGYYIPELGRCRPYMDEDVVDNKNLTPPEAFYHARYGTLSDEADEELVKSHWRSWIEGEGEAPAPEKDEDPETPKEMITRYRQMANSHMIVAALITTVALTAGFAMPGGFDGNQGPYQGSAVLLRKTAFKTFIVADTVALVLSISSLFLYFLTSFKLTTGVIFNMLITAIVLNVVSIAAMMVAFIAGTYAVLSHLKVLAIIVCIISSTFLLLISSFCFIPLRRLYMRILVDMRLHRKLNTTGVDPRSPLPEHKELLEV